MHGESSMKLDFREAAPVKVTDFSHNIWQKNMRSILPWRTALETFFASQAVNLEKRQKCTKSDDVKNCSV